MPYIKPERREWYDKWLASAPGTIQAGDLAYVLTRIIQRHYTGLSPWMSSTYQLYAEIFGVLETIKLEFYRKAIAPYEDKKSKENGDVF